MHSSSFDLLFSLNVPHVLTKIFLFLEPEDLENSRLVCHRWNDFIDDTTVNSKRIRDIIRSRKLLKLWKKEDFAENTLDTKGMVKWSEVDIEGIYCSGNDIIMAANEDRCILFRNLKFYKQRYLNEGERILTFYSGTKVIVVLLQMGKSFVILKRENLEVLNRIKTEDVCDRAGLTTVDGKVYWTMLKEDEVIVRVFNDKSGELDMFRSYSRQELSQSQSINKSTRLINGQHLLVVNQNGWMNLVDYNGPNEGRQTIKQCQYSQTSENFVKRAVLTKTYCGAIYHRTTLGKNENAYNFTLFDNQTGNLLASKEGIEAYGRIFFSASEKFFVFSYADAMHNQHFLVRDMTDTQKEPTVFTLTDRSHPMRSMQILKDRLLILSFYRTASALNIFDLDSLPDSQDSGKERVLRLPTGVIGFQSSHDDCHSQKLVLYKEVGVLCQRLDYSSENLVFSLRFLGKEDNRTARTTAAVNTIQNNLRDSNLIMRIKKYKQMFR